MARICRIPSSFQFTPLREGRRILFPPTVLFSNFNSRPSARGDQQIKRITIFQHYFNSRPSARGDTRNRRHCWQWQRFQFTPLREGRRAAAAQSSAAINISIHAPPRGATSDAGRSLQSSNISIHAPPRGATIAFLLSSRNPRISIHAPPRGATSRKLWRQYRHSISIHAPPRGATTCSPRIRWKQSNFNSRPSARGDECLTSSCPSPMISIHAPPRGATLPDGASTTSFVAFQFTPLREGRQSSIINGLQGDYFNSRPSARGDASRQCRASGSTTYFNSRPSARGDCSRSARRVRPFYFNSRPSARGDGKGVAAIVLPNYFNSRPSARGDRWLYTKPSFSRHFNSRPSARGDRLSARSANLAFHFNSRPSARGDSKVTALYNKREVFQFTPLREGRPCRTRHPRLVSISIHAPPRGATRASACTTRRYRNFNSRPSARGDPSSWV